MSEWLVAGGVLLVCVVVVFIISRCWIALVDGIGKLLFGRFQKRREPAAWHRLEDTGGEEAGQGRSDKK